MCVCGAQVAFQRHLVGKLTDQAAAVHIQAGERGRAARQLAASVRVAAAAAAELAAADAVSEGGTSAAGSLPDDENGSPWWLSVPPLPLLGNPLPAWFESLPTVPYTAKELERIRTLRKTSTLGGPPPARSPSLASVPCARPLRVCPGVCPAPPPARQHSGPPCRRAPGRRLRSCDNELAAALQRRLLRGVRRGPPPQDQRL